ncbi:MAG: hypothetical protein JOZ78_20455 [Chroococcidiopsidaceae cyanobacterium CP_BM_ER_R8_30]|nr:hypothetical protein [Chroococcidiopsidaceae cyanobacterium CP_BM_ER_R8_30]
MHVNYCIKVIGEVFEIHADYVKSLVSTVTKRQTLGLAHLAAKFKQVIFITGTHHGASLFRTSLKHPSELGCCNAQARRLAAANLGDCSSRCLVSTLIWYWRLPSCMVLEGAVAGVVVGAGTFGLIRAVKDLGSLILTATFPLQVRLDFDSRWTVFAVFI